METKTLYGRVSPPWWDEVWIVACGPSARAFDLDRLAGKTVVTVNNAYALLTVRQSRCVEPTMFSADPDWVRAHRDLLAGRPGEHYVAVNLDSHPDLGGIEGVTYLERAHFTGLSEEPSHLCTGGNSGYAAINLAYLKHANEIHLIGYDMDPKERGNGDKFAQWAPLFRSMIPQLSARQCRVINHNPASFVGAFPLSQE